MSANVTLAGSQASEFAADTTARTATLQGRGGQVFNLGTDTLWIAEGQVTVATDGSDQNSVSIASGAGLDLAPTTAIFAFKAGSSSATVRFKPRGF